MFALVWQCLLSRSREVLDQGARAGQRDCVWASTLCGILGQRSGLLSSNSTFTDSFKTRVPAHACRNDAQVIYRECFSVFIFVGDDSGRLGPETAANPIITGEIGSR